MNDLKIKRRRIFGTRGNNFQEILKRLLKRLFETYSKWLNYISVYDFKAESSDSSEVDIWYQVCFLLLIAERSRNWLRLIAGEF